MRVAPPDTRDAGRRLHDWMDFERAQRIVDEANGQVRAVSEAGLSQYRYDPRGDLTEVVEPNGAATAFAYDRQRRLTAVLHPDGAVSRYQYGSNDRLLRVEDRGVVTTYEHDAAGRVTHLRQEETQRFKYDEQGRIREARTALVSTRWEYDAHGQIVVLEQAMGGATLRTEMAYDADHRLVRVTLPATNAVIRYAWNEQARPAAVWCGEKLLARWTYDNAAKTVHVQLGNGVVEAGTADLLDSRPLWRTCASARGDSLLAVRYTYDDAGHVSGDGTRSYTYDALGRLIGDGERQYVYDAMDNLTHMGEYRLVYDLHNRLIRMDRQGAPVAAWTYDAAGRPEQQITPNARRDFRYDGRGCLTELAEDGRRIAAFTYDHKGRLVRAGYADHVERYVYGAADELLAITDDAGQPSLLCVRTPLGLLALVDDAGNIWYTHHDARGTCRLITGEDGQVAARFDYTPYGEPAGSWGTFRPIFGGRLYHPAVGMYDFGARWYDPARCRFLTPDACTALPNDMRLLQPFVPASRQAAARDRVLGTWLKHPRWRNRYVYCGQDPLNRHDPDGHWSFGGVLLMILGTLWAMPLTLLGLAVEVLNLLGELFAWIARSADVRWETPGFDAAASSRLQTYALVFTGGWLGSFPRLLAMAFGNVFFVYKHWARNERFFGPGDYYPPAYNGGTAIPRHDALYEHELRHVNHANMFGVFYHFALPLWGVYEWDVILSGGYWNAWAENNARSYSEGDARPDAPAAMTPVVLPPPPAPLPAPAPARYGGYDLRRGDRDAGFVYGGAARSAPAVLPPVGGTGFVRQLQDDLRVLGFRLIDTAENGVFGRTTEWAVREFQIYAKMENVAQETALPPTGLYVDRLMRAANPPDVRYTGPVSGVANPATRSALAHWLANRLRCPVVISAYTVDAAGVRTGVFNNHENIWRHQEVTSQAPRVFARDFSGYYTLPTGHNPDDFIVVGEYSPEYLGGPVSMPPRHSWAEAEVLPQHLVGAELADLSPAQRSTFKVIRAVAEVECIGFFDSLNAYDTGFLSLGPCHWTLAILFGGVMNEGELGAYLAYLRLVAPDAFAAAVGFFGVRTDENWVQDGVASGAALYAAGQRKYTGWIACQDDTGNYVRQPLTQAEADRFRGWHWMYRFEMAGRTIAGYRRRMWDMARIRLRDIRSARWPAAAHVPNVPDGAGGTRRATVGDVYTSERAAAMLLRWHVNMPATMFSGGIAGNRLVHAFQRAAIPAAAGNPTAWTDTHEANLIQGIRDEITAIGNANLIDTINQVDGWPAWTAGGAANPRHFTLDPAIGNLAVTRNSLQFDAADLPPTPYP